jgi:hypothetical protein
VKKFEDQVLNTRNRSKTPDNKLLTHFINPQAKVVI